MKKWFIILAIACATLMVAGCVSAPTNTTNTTNATTATPSTATPTPPNAPQQPTLSLYATTTKPVVGENYAIYGTYVVNGTVQAYVPVMMNETGRPTPVGIGTTTDSNGMFSYMTNESVPGVYNYTITAPVQQNITITVGCR